MNDKTLYSNLYLFNKISSLFLTKADPKLKMLISTYNFFSTISGTITGASKIMYLNKFSNLDSSITPEEYCGLTGNYFNIVSISALTGEYPIGGIAGKLLVAGMDELTSQINYAECLGAAKEFQASDDMCS